MTGIQTRFILLCVVTMFVASCTWSGVMNTFRTAGASGADAAASGYARGDLEAGLPADVRDVHAAALAALAARGYTVDRKQVDSLKGSIDATAPSKTEERTTVKIRAQRQPDDTTRLSIRVGVFGDEPLSRELLKDIETNLK